MDKILTHSFNRAPTSMSSTKTMSGIFSNDTDLSSCSPLFWTTPLVLSLMKVQRLVIPPLPVIFKKKVIPAGIKVGTSGMLFTPSDSPAAAFDPDSVGAHRYRSGGDIEVTELAPPLTTTRNLNSNLFSVCDSDSDAKVHGLKA
jgi:hypothetical protein